ncbi:pleckstrin homology domain-containing family G member 3 isoform X3 [Myripristis murdjan]|uniref:pleckstrin homology domain-containing family G member 3 isoform X3 n=1 Tax=Myripristis murdjan TaxID=586833 RepID=UPI0011762810|nr:pleckstrin homology domain-containing family G member 3-like isoform X3 [Myripristis murdjan]
MPEGSHSALHQGLMGEESPRLCSPLSANDHDRTSVDLGTDCYSRLCVEPLDRDGERPVSLVSTLSSGSSRDSHSLFGSTAALPSSTTPPIPSEEDIDLELSPTEGAGEQAGEQSPTLGSSRGQWQEQLEPCGVSSQRNNNNATASSRKPSVGISHTATSPVAIDAMAPNPKLTYVDRVVMEIIETERTYVRDLRSIVEDYLAHIIDMGSLPIRPEQVCALFGNIEDIYEFNSELLQSLDMCENDPVAVARCFVDKSEYFEIYTQYCTNYPNSVAALTDCMRSKTLAKFFRERQASLKRSLPLGSYLLKPVQRILKYHLLLQEIAKHFDQEEEGYEVVQEAIDTMTGVAWYINDMKRKHEHAVRVQEIQSLLINWKGPDLTTYGELVLEGTFHVQRAKNTRTLFLFDKVLLITKKRGEHYVYKTHISCSTLMLLDSAKDPLLFSVIHFKHPKQPHTVQAKSVEEKRLWAHNIKRLILENHHTIVPQKAKEAMLEMDSIYPGKYRYSPERPKKAESCQAEDFPLGRRHGRRRSEPAKQIMRSTKAVLKDEQDRNGDGNAAEQQTILSEEVETFSQVEEPSEVPAEEALATQVSMEEMPHPNFAPKTESNPKLEGNYSQCPESPVVFPSHPQEGDTPELEDISSRGTGEDEEGESDSSGLQVEETSVLTNSEFSEEEEEVFSDNKSILPPSVLDQAGVIAERFVSSLSRRSSLVSEDLHSLDCSSSPLGSEISNNPFLCINFEEKTQVLTSSSLEPQLTPGANQSPPAHEPAPHPLMEVERRSTLSKQDRLLIHKIRRYYENAEHQDANFSIKRRESLSYIPAGLVRHLSRQLNSIPQDQAAPIHRRGTSHNRPTSWSVFDLPGLEKNQRMEPSHKFEPQKTVEGKARSESVSDKSSTNEEFRPSSDMLKVWQDMEMEVNNSIEEKQEIWQIQEERLHDSSSQVTQETENSIDTSNLKSREEPLCILEETKISTVSEGSPISTPTTITTKEGGSGKDSWLSKTPKSQDKSRARASLPKIISLRSSMDDDQILQDMGKMKNKVFQLARQYSQRIKSNRPVVRPRNRGSENQQGSKNMPAVHEEKTQWREKGKTNLTLPLNTHDHMIIHELRSPVPAQTPSSGASSEVTSPNTLLATSPVQTDTFHWPDVQELRSKYARSRLEPGASHHTKVARSCSVPERMLECCTDTSSSSLWKPISFSTNCSDSSDPHRALMDSPDAQPRTVYQDRSSQVKDWFQPQHQPPLCRWSSLDHMLVTRPLHEVQNLQEPVRSCYIASQPALPSEHKVVIVERVPGARPREHELTTRENSKLQDKGSLLREGLDCAKKSVVLSSGKKTESNLVKNLREKFQSLSSSS